MTEPDVSNDWQYIDWLQAITYYVRQGEIYLSNGISCQALKRADMKSFDMAWNELELSTHTCIWEVWVTSISIPNIIPKRGDKFTASGISGVQTWVVDGVDYCDKTTRFRLKCTQQNFGN